jgi:hypothetical protein
MAGRDRPARHANRRHGPTSFLPLGSTKVCSRRRGRAIHLARDATLGDHTALMRDTADIAGTTASRLNQPLSGSFSPCSRSRVWSVALVRSSTGRPIRPSSAKCGWAWVRYPPTLSAITSRGVRSAASSMRSRSGVNSCS